MNSEWTLPKHVSLCMALRHLYHSKELLTLMNRLGHCESYTFSLELETGIANAIEQSSTLLTNQIIRRPIGPSVFHSEFDNFDEYVNDLSGKGSVHTAHGIMMQETTDDKSYDFNEDNQIPKDRKRSLVNAISEPLPECFISQRKSPVISLQENMSQQCESAKQQANCKDVLWLISRTLKCDTQVVQCWGGFVSSTGLTPERLTRIDYYPMIYHPITEYSTVQECLMYAQRASDEVGQNFVYCTFDLGVCMKAFPLLWNYPLRFSRHIVMIGTFHLTMGYLRMMGKKMEASGFTDVLLESNLISPGSLQGVLSGKNYNRAMSCHKVLNEALHRLLMKEFAQSYDCSILPECLTETSRETLANLTENITSDNLTRALNDDGISMKIEEYLAFCDNARKGSLGKTGQFWISYMDHVSLIFKLLRAIKTNSFDLYAYCIREMCDLFFSFGGHNYARYLTYFSAFITNIEASHPGALEEIKRGVLSVARSQIPGNRCEVDKTMEETLMKNSKSRGGAGGSSAGISGLTRNYAAYQRWIRTMHERCRYLEGIHALADIDNASSASVSNKDMRPSEIRRGEAKVEATVDAINNFVNPFTISDNESLYCISSGAKVPDEIENDILNAERIGKLEKEKFIEERLEKNERFFDPIKNPRLKTMGDMCRRVKVTTKQNKVVELKQSGNIAFQLLVKTQNRGKFLDLQEVMKYQLTPVPSCIGTPDGYLGKTNKSKGLKYLPKEI